MCFLAMQSGEQKYRICNESLVSDERFCDGLYFAMSLRQLRRIMKNPAQLEIPLEKKVEDVE